MRLPKMPQTVKNAAIFSRLSCRTPGCFYLPQWVAFDESCNLLVKSTGEAEAYLASMQSFLGVLHAAVSVASYIMADPVYQQKRYGMLGQLVNQGRALAMFEAQDMIRIIKQRAAAHDLNRGLSLSLPYFDDQALELRTRDFEVIPSGRIMFVPAFVVRAAREEAGQSGPGYAPEPIYP